MSEILEASLPMHVVRAPPITAKRGFRRAQRSVPMDPRTQAQESLNLRFTGLESSSFHADGIFICTITTLDPPSGFEDAWCALDGDWTTNSFNEEKAHRMSNCPAVLLVADPEATKQVCASAKLLRHFKIDCPLIWLPHAATPKAYGHQHFDPALHEQVLQSGVDDVIPGWPQGPDIVIAVRSRMSRIAKMTSKINGCLELQQAENAKAKFLLGSVNQLVWDFLRRGSGASALIPDMHDSSGIPLDINGLHRTTLLGKGAFGKVYSLSSRGQAPSGEVMKCIEKKATSCFEHVMSIAHEIQIMKVLSDKYTHPNVTRLYEVYHNRSHIIFRMEDGGNSNLYRRLAMRDKNGEDAGHLSSSKVAMLILQAISAVEHLHSTCYIAHLDIKPENICVKESPEDIVCKLTDFDAAMIVKPLQRCKYVRGTFPFTAPEAYLPPYRPFPADIWSLGVLLSEIVCGLRMFDRAFHFAEQKMTIDTARCLMPVISNRLANEGAADRLVQNHARSELVPLAALLGSMFGRMLIPSAEHRISASEVLQVAELALHAESSNVSADASAQLVAKD